MRFERNIHSVCADLAPRKFEFVRHYTMPCAHWSKHRACVRVKRLRMRNEGKKKKKKTKPEFQLGRFLWNARVIKSPDEWAITKQACRSEKYIFSVFSPIAIWGKSLPSSTVKRKNQYSDFLYIYSTALMRPRGPKKYCLQLYICIPCSLALSTTCLACCELISFIQALTVASFITRLSPSWQFHPVEKTQHVRKEKSLRQPNESTMKQK